MDDQLPAILFDVISVSILIIIRCNNFPSKSLFFIIIITVCTQRCWNNCGGYYRKSLANPTRFRSNLDFRLLKENISHCSS